MRATIQALTIGLLSFSLLLGLGQAMAGDVGSADDADNTLTAGVISAQPEITGFDITDFGDLSFMHDQLDVDTTYYFNVTVGDPDGWGDMQWINIRAWYDGGAVELTFDLQAAAGANYRVDLNYTNSGGVPDVTEWIVTEGNIVYVPGSSSIFENVANENYTFKLAFTLNNQIRQAADPITSGSVGYDDLDSWNAEVRAKDFGNPDIINQASATSVYHEFGVFMFTTVSIGTDWDAGAISPGGNAVTNTVMVTHAANDDYRLSVWFDTTLTDTPNTIPITAINITAAGHVGDAIDSDIPFVDLGIGFREYIWGSAGTEQAHDAIGDSETTGVQFGVSVPFGTPTGTYIATLTIRVETPL